MGCITVTSTETGITVANSCLHWNTLYLTAEHLTLYFYNVNTSFCCSSSLSVDVKLLDSRVFYSKPWLFLNVWRPGLVFPLPPRPLETCYLVLVRRLVRLEGAFARRPCSRSVGSSASPSRWLSKDVSSGFALTLKQRYVGRSVQEKTSSRTDSNNSACILVLYNNNSCRYNSRNILFNKYYHHSVRISFLFITCD